MANLPKLIEEMGAYRPDETTIKGDQFMSDDNLGFEPTSGMDEAGDYFTPDFSETHDEVCLTDGTQAQLRIVSIKDGKDKHGAPDRRILLEVVDEPYAKVIGYYLGLPGPNDDARARNRKNLRVRDFLTAFGIATDGTPFRWGDLVGLSAWAIVSYVPGGDFPEKNEVKQWVKSA